MSMDQYQYGGGQDSYAGGYSQHSQYHPGQMMGSLHPGYDFDQQVQNRPWQDPGADLSEYFNYGMDEHSFLVFISKHFS